MQENITSSKIEQQPSRRNIKQQQAPNNPAKTRDNQAETTSRNQSTKLQSRQKQEAAKTRKYRVDKHQQKMIQCILMERKRNKTLKQIRKILI